MNWSEVMNRNDNGHRVEEQCHALLVAFSLNQIPIETKTTKNFQSQACNSHTSERTSTGRVAATTRSSLRVDFCNNMTIRDQFPLLVPIPIPVPPFHNWKYATKSVSERTIKWKKKSVGTGKLSIGIFVQTGELYECQSLLV